MSPLSLLRIPNIQRAFMQNDEPTSVLVEQNLLRRRVQLEVLDRLPRLCLPNKNRLVGICRREGLSIFGEIEL